MITIKELTNNYTAFSVYCFDFKSQTEVYYNFSVLNRKFRFSKADLIGCINYYLDRLKVFIDINKVKHGFVFDKFRYYDLSVYLHGILQLYCSTVGFAPVGKLYIKRFSHLPHDVLKPELKNITLQVAKLEDMFGGTYYCCVISGIPIVSDTFDTLREKIYGRFLNIGKHYNICFDLLDLRSLPF